MFRSYRDTVRIPVQVTTKTKIKKYYCDMCHPSQQKVWEAELDVELHRRKNHKSEIMQLLKEPDNFMCTVCLRPQEDKQSLIAHIKTQHLLSSANATRIKRELFICDYCNNLFFNKTLLIAHIRWFHLLSNKEKKTTTTICPLCFKQIPMTSLWFHFLHHEIVHPGTCPVCIRLFEDYKDVVKHVDSHPGCYKCNICPYEGKNESLFLNHIEKHTKMVNLEGKDVNAVRKYFVPQGWTRSWNRKYVNIFKGIPLAAEIQICILCCTMCETDNDLLHHIYGDHCPEDSGIIKKYLCACGEELFNAVLLKHHVFTMKGNHRPYDGLGPPNFNFKRIENPRKLELLDSTAEIEITVERNTPWPEKKKKKCLVNNSIQDIISNFTETETVGITNESNDDENIMCYEIHQEPDNNENGDSQIMCEISEGNETNDSQNENNDSQNKTNGSRNEFNDTTFGPSEVYCEFPLVTIKSINKEGQYTHTSQEEIVYEVEVPSDSDDSQRAAVE